VNFSFTNDNADQMAGQGLHPERVRAWQAADSRLSLSLPLIPAIPTPQPSPEGASQTSGAATADGQLPLPLFSAIPTTQPPFEAAIQLVRDGIAAVVLEEEGSRAPQQSGHATADGQLPLPLFSTMLTTQPPSERATQLTGRANAASLSLSSSSFFFLLLLLFFFV
jgi:hypothetical protein